MLPLDMIVGMDEAKAAILCLAVDPSIRGAIIRGPPGTGKSELVRSVSAAIGEPSAVVPLNVTQEQLFGSLDLERALSTGEAVLRPGLLSRSGFLTVDDVNLLDRATVRQMMDSVVSGRVAVERDGLSASYPCGVSIIATVNSREARLDRATSDLFDICVDVRGPTDPEVRCEISRNCLSGVEGTGSADVAERVRGAKAILPDVRADDAMIRIIVEACEACGSSGSRGEISATRVARALAALEGRTIVNIEDAKRACVMCLAHRRGRVKRPVLDTERVQLFGDSHMQRFIHDDRRREEPREEETQTVEAGDVPLSEDAPEGEARDVVAEVGEIFEAIDLVEDSRSRRSGMDDLPKRRDVMDGGREGRYVSSRPLSPGSTDVAIDATVRAAAPYQRARREREGTDRVVILREDLMQKVRERHSSCLFLFMVDNSGSLVVRSRMRAVKAAILSILGDHYARRDSVSVVTFNGDFVGPILTPTRSVGCLKGVLEDMPAGSMTPLSEALAYGDSMVSTHLRKHPGERCFIVLMTDARANIPMVEGADPFEEAVSVASRIRCENAEWVMVDTSSTDDPEHRASRLAEALRAPYYRLDDLRLQ